MVPPPKKFSQLLDGSDHTFKEKIEKMVEKLKTMDDSHPSVKNFDQLLQSLVVKAKEESRSKMEMEAKVAMVDNLVNLFIKGNALRAQKMKNIHNKKPDHNPVTLKTKENFGRI